VSGWLIPDDRDPIQRGDTPITIMFGDRELAGVTGQTLAGVLLGNGIMSWRADVDGRPRGLFCGIGVCFDCVATVNDHADVRLCRRRAHDGDRVAPQARSAP
jgi:D-hydroxyproline dehydrogenase subunit gamma